MALLISVPIGIAAAIYLSEYASDNWFTRVVNLAVVNLAGVPSIVHALFGRIGVEYQVDLGADPCRPRGAEIRSPRRQGARP